MSSKIANMLAKLNVFKSKDPKLEFLLGKDALAQGNYKKALHHFKIAYQHYKNLNSKINALENAIIAASRLKDPLETFILSYQLAKLVAATSGMELSRILSYLESTWRTALLLVKNDALPQETLGEVTVVTFLAYLANQQFEDCQRVIEKARSYLPAESHYLTYMEEALRILSSEESFVEDWRLPSISLPKEFAILVEKAEAVARSHANLKVTVLADPRMVQVNEDATVIVTIKAHAPLTVTQLDLEHLPRGLRMASSTVPELPHQMSRGDELTVEYVVRAQLEGTWEVGPVKVQYRIIDRSRSNKKSIPLEFVVSSNKEQIIVKSRDAQLHSSITMSFRREPLEEDAESMAYLLDVTCSVKNAGESLIENLVLSVEFPKELELIEGTNTKRILELHAGEQYEFPLTLKLKSGVDLQALLEKNITLITTSGDDNSILARSTHVIKEEDLALEENED